MNMENAEARFAQQLKKGVLEMLVLALLAEKPGHGYELLLRLKEISGGELVLKEGTLYPILYRLEDGGAITAGWQAPEPAAEQGGANPYRAVPRKVYTVTPAGRALLAGQTKIWRQFAACVQSFIGREEDDE